MTDTRRTVNNTITMGEALAGTTFSAAQLLTLLDSTALETAIPYWGVIQGTLKMVCSAEPLLEYKTFHLPSIFNTLTNANLIFQSARTLGTGMVGLVPWSFALCAVVELADSAKKAHDTYYDWVKKYPD